VSRAKSKTGGVRLRLRTAADKKLSRREISAISSLEKLMSKGDYIGVKRRAKKVIYRELSNNHLKERAVYLGAYAMVMLGEYRFAEEFLKEHKFVPDNLDRFYVSCFLSLKLNKTDDVIKYAAEYLRKYRRIPADNLEKVLRSCELFEYEIHNNVGAAYKNKGNIYKAAREFRLAIKLNPKHFESIANLISLLYEQNRFGEALREVEKALKVFPDEPYLKSLYGIILFGFGDREKGKRILEEIVSANPENVDAICNLGVMYEKAGEFEKARDCYRKAIAIDPEHRNSNDNLFSLEVEHFGRKPTISLCMIVKDEEDNIARCLNSISDVVDQIVVVDTGSTDRTPEIAKEYGAEVYFHPWRNSFAEARNNSIKYATGDWIIYLDADEELFEEDKQLLLEAAKSTRVSAITVQIFNPLQGELEGYLQFPRMWRNSLGFYFDGIVHNQLIFDGTVYPSKIRIRHYGYGWDEERMVRKFKRSEKLLFKQLEEDPNNTFALFNLAQIKRGLKEYDEVIKYASKIVELIDPKDTRHLHTYLMATDQLCSAYFFKGDFDKSIDIGLKALKIKQDYFDPMLTMGSAFTAKGDYDNALKYYNLFLEIIDNFNAEKDKTNIIYNNLGSKYFAYYGIGLIMKAKGRKDEAEHYFRMVTNSVENHIRVHYELGKLAFDRGDYESAEYEFNEDLRYNPDVPESFLMLGEIKRKYGDIDEASALYERALEKSPNYNNARFSLAKLHNDLGNYSKAKDYLTVILKSNEKFIDAYLTRGNINFQLGDYQSAIDDYKSYIDAYPKDYKVIGNLANSYFRLEDYEKALEYYRKVVDIKPNYGVVHYNLGICYEKLKKWNDAAGEFIEYYNLKSGDNSIFVQIGDCLASARRFSDALRYYEQYLSSHPGDYLALFKLAECYRFAGVIEAAVLGYKAVLKLNPDFKPALEMISLIRNEAAKT